MKFKHFLRGLGIGIIFASIISITAFQASDMNKISDKEVIERAKELGMVEKQESVQDTLKKEPATEGTKEKVTTETVANQDTTTKDESQTKKKTTKDNTSEQKTTEEKTTKEKTTEEKTTEQMTTKATTQESTTQKSTTEKSTTQEKKPEKKTVQITIRGGMSSYPVCQMLQELGMVKDAAEFDDYLVKNGYANRISVGTHTLTIGMSFEEIAIAISDPK